MVAAIHDKKLLPVSNMDQGFIFPEYPGQVLVSYWQAGTICDYIAERWGIVAILGMVHSFAALKDHAGGQPQDNLQRVCLSSLDKDWLRHWLAMKEIAVTSRR